MSPVRIGTLWASVTAALLISSPTPAHADAVTAELNGFQEVPALYTDATGNFAARLNEDGNQLGFTLSYSGITSTVQFAHIHFAQRGVNGGVIVWLCDNTGSGPSGTQTCPSGEGTVEGTITSENVMEVQGIAAGDFTALLKTIAAEAAYINVHSETFPGGELRGQLAPAFGIEMEENK